MNEHVIKCIFNKCGLIVDMEVDMIKHLDEEHFGQAAIEGKESNLKRIQKDCKFFNTLKLKLKIKLQNPVLCPK